MMIYFISVWEDPAWGQAHPGGPGGHAGTSMPGEASGSGGDWAQAPALSQGLLPTPGEAGLGVVNTIIPPIPLPLFLTFFVLSFNLQAFMGVNILGVLNIFPVEV